MTPQTLDATYPTLIESLMNDEKMDETATGDDINLCANAEKGKNGETEKRFNEYNQRSKGHQKRSIGISEICRGRFVIL